LKIRTAGKETRGLLGKIKEKENVNWQMISRAGSNLVFYGSRRNNIGS
jgi:hypothetical protein